MTDDPATAGPGGPSGSALGRRRVPWRRWAWVGVIAAVVAVLVAGAVLGGTWLDGSPGRPAARGYQPTDQQQATECDGVPAPPPQRLRLLPKDSTVTAAVVCADGEADLRGRGRWQVRRVVAVPAAGLPGLVSALELTDREGGTGACSAMLVVVPDFVLTRADGSRIRPGVPGDGCHPRAEVIDALRAAAAHGQVRSTVPVSRIATEQEVTTGCGAEAKSPAVWLDAGGASSAAQQRQGLPIPASGTVALCRYRPGDADPIAGSLTATGTAPAGAVTDVIHDLAAAAPAGCPSSTGPEDSPSTD